MRLCRPRALILQAAALPKAIRQLEQGPGTGPETPPQASQRHAPRFRIPARPAIGLNRHAVLKKSRYKTCE